VSLPGFAQIGIITSVAGGGPNDIPATQANVCSPTAVILDSDGNLYVTSYCEGMVLRVDHATGILTVAAGNGVSGFAGDGGAATSTSLFSPFGLAMDTVGNLFISETAANRVRRVDAVTGVITTLAGNGTQGFAGDNGPAISASLSAPNGIIIDPFGHSFIADSGNDRIRRVDAVTGLITTVAGGGQGCGGQTDSLGDGCAANDASLNNPYALAIDERGNLFIADAGNSRVRRVDATTHAITTVAGGGGGCASQTDSVGDGCLPTLARLGFPNGLLVDAAGNLLIGDSNNRRVRRVDASTQIITTVAGNGTEQDSGDNGPATSAGIQFPAGIALDNAGNLFIADTYGNLVRRVDAGTQVITTVAGNGTSGYSGDGFPATNASLFPNGVAVDGAGNLLIADENNDRIRRVDAADGENCHRGW